jgi:hypothetical protein
MHKVVSEQCNNNVNNNNLQGMEDGLVDSFIRSVPYMINET